MSSFEPPDDPVDRAEYEAWCINVVCDEGERRARELNDASTSSLLKLMEKDRKGAAAILETVKLAREYRKILGKMP